MTETATHKNEYEIVTDLVKAISNWQDPKDPHLGKWQNWKLNSDLSASKLCALSTKPMPALLCL